jgi:hypothetical protein
MAVHPFPPAAIRFGCAFAAVWLRFRCAPVSGRCGGSCQQSARPYRDSIRSGRGQSATCPSLGRQMRCSTATAPKRVARCDADGRGPDRRPAGLLYPARRANQARQPAFPCASLGEPPITAPTHDERIGTITGAMIRLTSLRRRKRPQTTSAVDTQASGSPGIGAPRHGVGHVAVRPLPTSLRTSPIRTITGHAGLSQHRRPVPGRHTPVAISILRAYRPVGRRGPRSRWPTPVGPRPILILILHSQTRE